MKKQSKFTHCIFYNGFDDYAVSQQRFTRDDAIGLYIQEQLPGNHIKEISVGQAWVKWGYGYDHEQNKPCAAWWIQYHMTPRACPVWVFHVTGTRSPKFEEGYTVIDIPQWKEKIKNESRN